MKVPRLGVAILAAGEASRFGACKPLAHFQGKPLLQHVIDVALALDHHRLIVVTGKWHQALVDAQKTSKLSTVALLENHAWSLGIGSSISLAARHLASDCDQLLVLLADQVLVASTDIQSLFDALPTSGASCARYDNTIGPPAVFSAAFFEQLYALSGERGAKTLLMTADKPVETVAMAAAAWDVDTPADLEQLVANNAT